MNMVTCALDVETTGTIPGLHEICEVAFAVYKTNSRGSSEIVQRFLSPVRPMRPDTIDMQALEVNGFTIGELMSAPTPMQVRSKFSQWWIETLGTQKLMPLAHNFVFDHSFLRLFFNHHYDEIFDYHYADTAVLARALRSAGKLPNISTSLKSLSEHFGIGAADKLHSSYGDVCRTIEVHDKLVELIK